ncbi:hypothetical protein HPB52_024663 [Rhipicephalus sanguineus]|uniref:Endonuclease/exonuclease/phosphatase domain-containing protein n=1 Tax=Rhipicephalus sanguineus TaxID=34632 RepID=A0A9D4YS76_RHISA|nr:hypothetical protein HPB52_024663 [Rhipicephalus sanguineus]
MVLDPSCARDRPPAARKRLSSSVASEAADSESDVKSDDSEAFIPAKHRRSRRKSSTSSSSEETVIYSNIVITTVAYVPVDVSLCGVSTRAYIPQGANVTAGVISDVDLELQDDVLKSIIVCTPPCKINSSDSVRQREGQRRNFLSATSWPALPSKTSEPVSEKIASHKASEPASTKAPPTVENSVNNTVPVEDDAHLINLLKMLVNVIRALIAGRQTPAALAAEQLLEALVPVSTAFAKNSMNSRKPRPFVLQWNVRSLRPRHADLVLRLLAMNTPPDVIALQESNVRKDELRLPADPWGSDHLPIWLTPEHTPSRQTAAYRVTNWDKFRQLLSEAPSHDKMFNW